MHPSPHPDRALFETHLGRTKAVVDAALGTFLSRERKVATALHDDVAFLVRATEDLALRGGKRFRAALLAAAFEGYGGGDAHACAPALVALELLQVYFLVHDDWMDGDDTRRGGPSVPAVLKKKYGAGPFADAASLLAGDHASALAQLALAEMHSPHAAAAAAQFACMQRDVIFGQLLDMRAGPADDTIDVERTYLLKTGAYTVRGPIELGAILAGAAEDARAAIAKFADPLGIAFQLADDLLSTFGAEESTGKPALGDLRTGKRTWLVARAMKNARVRDAMNGVFGEASAHESALVALRSEIEKSGAKKDVEDRIAVLVLESRAALPLLHLTENSRAILAGAITALTSRIA